MLCAVKRGLRLFQLIWELKPPSDLVCIKIILNCNLFEKKNKLLNMESALEVLSRAATMVQDNANGMYDCAFMIVYSICI